MTGFLFPGRLDEACALDEIEHARPDLHAATCAVVKTDPFPRAREDTRFEQPVLVAVTLAKWARADERVDASLLVGEGTGEIAALAAADALSADDAIWLAAERGRLMSDATARLQLAAIALREVSLRSIRQLAAAHELSIASDNAPAEVVLVGRRTLIDAALITTRRLGLQATRVPASHATSSPHFASTRREWRKALGAVELRTPQRPVLSCATLRMITDPRTALAESLTSPTRTRQARRVLDLFGVRKLVPIVAGVSLAVVRPHGRVGHTL
jgi:acyl transferase domain-containing protein